MDNRLTKFIDGIYSNEKAITKEQIAEILKVSPEVYEEFEKAYKKYAFDPIVAEDIFSKENRVIGRRIESVEDMSPLIDRIASELANQSTVVSVRGGQIVEPSLCTELISADNLTPNDLASLSPDKRPQVLGDYMIRHTPEDAATPVLMTMYKSFLDEKDPTRKKKFYQLFRQGIDLLDLEPLIYEILKLDPNSMGKWLVPIVKANQHGDFFKIPDTDIIEVPMTLLQLSRIDYMSLNQVTLAIADRFCHKMVNLDPTRDYFVKTGTFSSKFDFRNARIHGEKEVNEIGQYLLFLSNTASSMASPMNNPVFYGVSSNNEWVIREYIEDVENNPCIYKGLPLHTEYRAFIDADEKELVGITPYWDFEMLANRFGRSSDADSPHKIHDYIILLSHRERLEGRFYENNGRVSYEIKKILPYLELNGQWSLDIMQNGEDFYIIDMSLATNSALANKMPYGKIKPISENLIPQIGAKV